MFAGWDRLLLCERRWNGFVLVIFYANGFVLVLCLASKTLLIWLQLVFMKYMAVSLFKIRQVCLSDGACNLSGI